MGKRARRAKRVPRNASGSRSRLKKLVLRAEHSEGIVKLARPRKTVEEAELEEVADAEIGFSRRV